MGQVSSKRRTLLHIHSATERETKRIRRGKTETHDQYCLRTSNCVSNQKVTTITKVDGSNITTMSTITDSGCTSTVLLFQSFPLLTDDIKILILSFIADGPFELMDDAISATSTSTTPGSSGLTHILPLVCKQFAHNYCMLDLYWKAALLRQMNKNTLWKRFINKDLEQQQQQHIAVRNDSTSMEKETATSAMTTIESATKSVPTCQKNDALLEQLLNAKFPINSHENAETVSTASRVGGDGGQCRYKELYRYILNEHVRYIGPVFCMPHPIRLGEPYGLHFFENRYRLLIASVTTTLDDRYKRGEHVIPYDDSPTFIHAHRVPITENRTIAVLVRMVRCHIYDDGRADVLLVPYQYVVIEKIWTLPDTGNLNHAQTRQITDYELQTLHRQQQRHEEEVQRDRQRRFRLLPTGLFSG